MPEYSDWGCVENTDFSRRSNDVVRRGSAEH